MGDDKVKESPAEVFTTVTEVNALFHSLEDMLATRFEAIDGKFGALEKNLAEMDARNERRFEAIDGRFGVLEKNLAEMDARNERRFEAIDGRFGVLEEKLAEMDARNRVQFAALETMIVELDTKTEGRFDLVEQKFKSQEFKIEHCVTSSANKQLIMMLVIAGSIIASLLYVG